MSVKNGQQQVMQQNQKLSPQQVMRFRLQRMPILELKQEVAKVIESNYMFEVDEHDEMMQTVELNNSQNEPDDDIFDDEENAMCDIDRDDDEPNSSDETSLHESDYENNDDIIDASIYNVDEGSYDELSDQRSSLVENCAVSVSFSDDLMWQLNSLNLTARQQIIAKEIVDSIADTGYLNRSVDLIANDISIQCKDDYYTDEVMEVLKIVQQLDPPGVAATSLHECLSLQVHRLNLSTLAWRNAVEIVDYHLDLLASKKYDLIRDKLQIDEATFKEALAIIHHLNPMPGGGGDVFLPEIMPDFVVEVHDNELVLSLTKGNKPDLRLNEDYMEILSMLKAAPASNATQKQIDDIQLHQNDAEDFILAIKERYDTMYKVMSKIVAVQRKFFFSGDENELVPLSQHSIAVATGLDDSTISRFVREKYVQTAFGTFPIQRCFGTAVACDDDTDKTALFVKNLLAKWVDEEDKDNPYTDLQLVEMLKKEKISISRRTVAKYRQELNIPGSAHR